MPKPYNIIHVDHLVPVIYINLEIVYYVFDHLSSFFKQWSFNKSYATLKNSVNMSCGTMFLFFFFILILKFLADFRRARFIKTCNFV